MLAQTSLPLRICLPVVIRFELGGHGTDIVGSPSEGISNQDNPLTIFKWRR